MIGEGGELVSVTRSLLTAQKPLTGYFLWVRGLNGASPFSTN